MWFQEKLRRYRNIDELSEAIRSRDKVYRDNMMLLKENDRLRAIVSQLVKENRHD